MITVECTIQFAASGFGIAPSNGNYSYFNQWLKGMKSCFVDTGLGTIVNDMNPFSPGAIGAAQASMDAKVQANALAAGAYSVERGLSVPLRSDAVRAAYEGLDFQNAIGPLRQLVGQLQGAEVLGKVSGWITIANLYYAIGDAYKNEWKQCGW